MAFFLIDSPTVSSWGLFAHILIGSAFYISIQSNEKHGFLAHRRSARKPAYVGADGSKGKQGEPAVELKFGIFLCLSVGISGRSLCSRMDVNVAAASLGSRQNRREPFASGPSEPSWLEHSHLVSRLLSASSLFVSVQRADRREARDTPKAAQAPEDPKRTPFELQVSISGPRGRSHPIGLITLFES